MTKLVTIKYAENDNISFSKRQRGWITMFMELLMESLHKIGGPDFIVDIKNENDVIDIEVFENSVAIIYILSPAFIFANDVAEEMKKLEKDTRFNLNLMNKKIFKVIKAPFEWEEVPQAIAGGISYDFYQYRKESENDSETFEGWGNAQEIEEYWDVMMDLTYDIVDLSNTGKTYDEEADSIFLDPNTKFYKKEREAIKRYLKRYGYNVVPDYNYQVESSYLEDPNDYYIEKSVGTIFFPDTLLKNNSHSLSVMEKRKELRHFIWFNPALSQDPELSERFNALKFSIKNFDHIEAIESPVEEFKQLLTETMAGSGKNDSDLKQIVDLYLIHDESSIHIVQKVQQALSKLNDFHFITSTDLVKTQQYRDLHLFHLINAKAVLIIYNNVPTQWLISNIKELIKSKGFQKIGQKKRSGVLLQNKELMAQAPPNDLMVLEWKEEADIEKRINTFLQENPTAADE